MHAQTHTLKTVLNFLKKNVYTCKCVYSPFSYTISLLLYNMYNNILYLFI